jgi:hypothetical protein
MPRVVCPGERLPYINTVIPVNPLRSLRLISVVILALVDIRLHLNTQVLPEERPALILQESNGCRVHAMVGNVEEAIVHGSIADLRGYPLAVCERLAEGTRDVDDGNLGGESVPGRGAEDAPCYGTVPGEEAELRRRAPFDLGSHFQGLYQRHCNYLKVQKVVNVQDDDGLLSTNEGLSLIDSSPLFPTLYAMTYRSERAIHQEPKTRPSE